MSLAIACDLVLAASSARFTMAYTRLGLVPDGSSSYFLPRLVGLKRAINLTTKLRTELKRLTTAGVLPANAIRQACVVF